MVPLCFLNPASKPGPLLPFLKQVGCVVVEYQNLVQSLGYFVNYMLPGSRGCPGYSCKKFRYVYVGDGAGGRCLGVHEVFRLLS